MMKYDPGNIVIHGCKLQVSFTYNLILLSRMKEMNRNYNYIKDSF